MEGGNFWFSVSVNGIYTVRITFGLKFNMWVHLIFRSLAFPYVDKLMHLLVGADEI